MDELALVVQLVLGIWAANVEQVPGKSTSFVALRLPVYFTPIYTLVVFLLICAFRLFPYRSVSNLIRARRLELCLVREMKIFDVISDVSEMSEGVFGY